MDTTLYTLDFNQIALNDISRVGGKNGSLGELFNALRPQGIGVLDGFATTADAYRRLLGERQLEDKLWSILSDFDPENVSELASRGHDARAAVLETPLPDDLRTAITEAYERLCARLGREPELAVRSSATAEDLPEASFAGAAETFLNVRGRDALLRAVHSCYASLFTDRAINYRARLGFDHLKVALSVGVQPMVRSDKASSGVIFTLDPESGFRDVVVITASYGLGEFVVQGVVTPDEWTVFKPTLARGYRPIVGRRLGTKEVRLIYGDGTRTTRSEPTPVRDRMRFSLKDEEVLTLARWASVIEEHYSRLAGRAQPMDIEWAKDGTDGKLYIVQARPETVHSAKQLTAAAEVYRLKSAPGATLVTGQAVGEKIGAGRARVVREPSGRVYAGLVPFEVERVEATSLPDTRTAVMLNVSDPSQAFSLALIPNSGVGLARIEFIITNHIGIHPMALARYPKLKDMYAVTEIGARVVGEDPREFFIGRLSEGVGRIAAAFYPKPVIVRTSDFKTNEYARLTGGREFEPEEENPMLGFRGASRYYDSRYAEGFALECAALSRVRRDFGLTNVKVMIPFCRTVREAEQVIAAMAANGLRQGEEGLEVYAMCELPANVVLADEFLRVFDGYLIGSNDLTQLVLGIDRDSGTIAHLFDERNEAVRQMIAKAIEAAKLAGKPIGICGQAPSDYPEFAAWLVEQGITSISLNPDSAIKTALVIASAEEKAKEHGASA